MSENTQLEISSPCIGVCAINDTNGFCHGCYRTIDEIKTWWDMGQVEQKDLLLTLAKRQSLSENF
jgi:hypothetical protein